MAVRELRLRYVGTGLGFVWGLLHPLAFVAVFWFVFSVGLKVRPHGDVPFLAYYLTGYLPWMLFTETLMASSNAVVGNPYLVKKTVFPTEILPVVHLIASLLNHLILLLLTLGVLVYYGTPLTPYLLQLPLAFLLVAMMALGLSWIFAALNVLYRDIGQSLPIVINLFFWATPVVWSIGNLPENMQRLIRLNPFVFMVESYRECLLYGRPLWDNSVAATAFVILAFSCFAFGYFTFNRLKPHFADVI